MFPGHIPHREITCHAALPCLSSERMLNAFSHPFLLSFYGQFVLFAAIGDTHHWYIHLVVTTLPGFKRWRLWCFTVAGIWRCVSMDRGFLVAMLYLFHDDDTNLLF